MVKPPDSDPKLGPIDRRKSMFSLGHMRRVRNGEAPLIPSRKTAEQALHRAVGKGEPVDWPDLTQATAHHRDAFRAEPQLAMQQRAQPQALSVRLPGEQVSQAWLYYDLEGRLGARLLSALRSDSPYQMTPTGRRRSLRPVDRRKIAAMRLELESSCHYSTLSGALALCRAVRLGRAAGNSQMDFRAAHAHFEVSGQQLLDHYGGATCYSLAEVMQSRIEQQLGMKAYLVSERINNFIAERPRLTGTGGEPSKEVLQLLEGDTHLDVLVPFYAADKQVHFLKIKMGGGPAMREEDAIVEIYADELSRHQELRNRHLMPEEKIIGNSRRLLALSLSGPSKLNLRDWQTDGIFGVDLFRRIAYLNNRATTAGSPAVQLDLNQPQDSGQIDFLATQVCTIFGMDKAAHADLCFLLHHVDSFCAQVLAGPSVALQQSIALRDRTVQWIEPLSELTLAGLLSSLPSSAALQDGIRQSQGALKLAAQAVRNGESPQANAAYSRALVGLQVAHQILHRELSQLSDADLQRCILKLCLRQADKSTAGQLITLIRSESDRRAHGTPKLA